MALRGTVLRTDRLARIHWKLDSLEFLGLAAGRMSHILLRRCRGLSSLFRGQ